MNPSDSAFEPNLLCQFFVDLVAEGVLPGLQRHLVRVLGQGVRQAAAHNLADAAVHLGGGLLVGLDLELGLAYLGHQFLDEADDLGVGFLGTTNGLQDNFLRHLVGAGLDHQDGVAGAADNHAQGAVVAFLVSGVDGVLPVPVGDTAGGHGPVEGNLRDGQRGRSAHHCHDFRRVFLVGGQHRQRNLDVVVQALGEQWADAAVGETGGEDAFLSGPALPPEEAAGDAAGGVQPLFVVNGQGQKVDVLGPGPV